MDQNGGWTPFRELLFLPLAWTTEWKQQIDNFLQREADSTLRDQDRLSIELETQKFLELEEGVRKFLEGGRK